MKIEKQISGGNPGRSVSLRKKLLFPLLLIGGIGGTVSVWFTYKTFSSRLEEQASRRVEALAHAVNYAAETMGRLSEAQRFILAISAEKDVEAILVTAGNPPKIVAADRLELIEKPLTELSFKKWSTDLQKVIQSHTESFYYSEDRKYLTFITPLLVTDTDETGGIFSGGAVLIHLNANSIRSQIYQTAFSLSIMQIGLIVSFIFLAYTLLKRIVLRPVAGMAEIMTLRATGEKDLSMPEFTQMMSLESCLAH